MSDHLLSYLRGFAISLRARNKAPRTVETYTLAVKQLAAFLDTEDLPADLAAIDRRTVEAHLAWLVEHRAAATAAQRFASLCQFFNWCVEEGELERSPMERLRQPSIPDKPVPILTDDQLTALLDVCRGSGFEARRDTAIIRCFIDTGARLAEVTNLTVESVDLANQQLVTVVKGRHVQVKYLGAKATEALHRYAWSRRRHRFADLDWWWLSRRAHLSASGIAQMLKRRAAKAGIGHVHPHQFRHSFAHRWLAAGGSEGDLVRLMGWRDRQMLDRYGASAAQVRARDAHRRMAPGDRL